jgi:hypothetical protein
LAFGKIVLDINDRPTGAELLLFTGNFVVHMPPPVLVPAKKTATPLGKGHQGLPPLTGQPAGHHGQTEGKPVL